MKKFAKAYAQETQRVSVCVAGSLCRHKLACSRRRLAYTWRAELCRLGWSARRSRRGRCTSKDGEIVARLEVPLRAVRRVVPRHDRLALSTDAFPAVAVHLAADGRERPPRCRRRPHEGALRMLQLLEDRLLRGECGVVQRGEVGEHATKEPRQVELAGARGCDPHRVGILVVRVPVEVHHRSARHKLALSPVQVLGGPASTPARMLDQQVLV
eukprot:5345887-Prymnesium_polylepis.3